MKPARITLTAISIFAIIGGILAFKTHRGITTFCRATAAGTGVCTTTYFNSSCKHTLIGVVYCTMVPGSICTATCTCSPIQ